MTCFLMTSCYYKDGCFYAPQAVSCNIKYRSDFDSYQKIGVKDKQKYMDMKNCLGIHGDNIDYKRNFIRDLNARFPKQNIGRKFYQCMNSKGYIFNDKY